MEILKNNIFRLPNKQFGVFSEKVIQAVLPELGLTAPNSDKCDLLDKDGNNIEVKSARARTRRVASKELSALLTPISEIISTMNNFKENNINCIFEHVKLRYFDTLIYSIYCDDAMYIYSISSKTLESDKNVQFSNKQTRDAEGDGQFHITKNNIDHHNNTYLIKKISYQDLVKLIKSQSI